MICTNNLDSINKTYKSCGCILTSELDIINNIINDKYVQICKNHLLSNRSDYLLSNCNQIDKHLSNSVITNSNNDYLSKNITEPYLNFGKYRNKTFSYVFNIDKLYCYNLAFWNQNSKKCKHINIQQFINFIKTQINV